DTDEGEKNDEPGFAGFEDPFAAKEGFQSIDLSKGQKLFDGMKKEEEKKEAASSSALGALLKAVKDEDPGIGRMPEATNPISAAVDDMFPDDTMKKPGKTSLRTSLNGMPEAANEIASAVDKWFDEAETGSQPDEESKPKAGLAISQAAAKLSEVLMSGDSDDIGSLGETGKVSDFSASGQPGFQGNRAKPNPSTSTSDALSRLLEAANKAPETVDSKDNPRTSSSREVSSLFENSEDFNNDARYDANDSDMRVRGFGSNDSTGGGLPSAGAGFSESGVNQSSEPGGVGTASKYDQDAVARRIAELNKKLDGQSLSPDAELPQAMAPEPSILPENSGRRDVVNRIMEEHATRQSEPEDYSQYQEQAGGFSPADLENISNNRLAAMADAEAGRSKGKNLRSRQGRGIGFDLRTPSMVVAVLIVFGYFAYSQNWLSSFPGLMNQITAMIPSGGAGGADSLAARDKEIASEFDKLYNSGQISKAVGMLEKYNEKVELSSGLGERLDKGYITLATWKGDHDARDEAVEILNLIPDYSDRYKEAKTLIKKYSKEKDAPKKS
ncbi:MAG: hypothetical protein K8F91_20395, partial [Candidatus Obscuribacterales bacterium]|nr:hypothetical protein [Candidatus Obscuribacterales bacterium]